MEGCVEGAALRAFDVTAPAARRAERRCNLPSCPTWLRLQPLRRVTSKFSLQDCQPSTAVERTQPIQYEWEKTAEEKTLGDLLSVTVMLCHGVYSCLQDSEWRTVDYAASEGAATWCHFTEPGCPTLAGFQGEVLPFFLILHGVAFCPECSRFVQLSGPSLRSNVLPGAQEQLLQWCPGLGASLLPLALQAVQEAFGDFLAFFFTITQK